jgi:phage shock protein PspC (stress-responsive transcriptional regulator)
MNSTPPHRLTRSTSDRKVGGVSGGLGAYFNLDPNLVRAGWIFSTLITGGAAIIAYVAMLAIVPTDDNVIAAVPA